MLESTKRRLCENENMKRAKEFNKNGELRLALQVLETDMLIHCEDPLVKLEAMLLHCQVGV